MNFKFLYDKNEMNKLQKKIDKNQSTLDIEKRITYFKQYKKQVKRIPNEQRNFFILVDYSEVKEKTFEKIQEWLDLLGNSLKDISTKELNAIIRDTNEY